MVGVAGGLGGMGGAGRGGGPAAAFVLGFNEPDRSSQSNMSAPGAQRYGSFALPATPGDGTADLFRPGPVATRAGRASEPVDARR